jgi:hypothetical protein
MPSNLIDDFLQGIDPIDAATLLAGIRNSVPLGMLFRSGELGPDEMTDLNRRRGPPSAPNPPTIDPVESNRRAQMDFEMQYPDPRIRELLIAEMLKESRNPYSSTTATRRRDFEEAPMSAQQYMSAAPKRKKFNKGGSAKKTLDQMMAEMAQKGTKLADKPDLARRGFLGLGKASDFPLAKLDTKALEKMQSELKGAPTITEKTVTVDPGKGAAKSTLKSISETPMSRREVLQSAAGQAMRGVLPDLGGLGAMGNVAKVAETVAPQAYEASAIPGLMAALMRTGMSPDEAGAMVEKLIPKAPQGWPTMVGDRIKAPAENMPHVGQDTPLMSIFGEMVRPAFQNGPYSVRPEMRDLRRLSPEDYAALKETARDIKQYGHEN